MWYLMTAQFTPEEYKNFQNYLEQACGIVLGDNKHYLVSSRLNRLMRDNKIDTLQTLVDELSHSKNALMQTRVIEAMTTNETLWFRDSYPFEVLSKTIFEDYKKAKKLGWFFIHLFKILYFICIY